MTKLLLKLLWPILNLGLFIWLLCELLIASTAGEPATAKHVLNGALVIMLFVSLLSKEYP